VTESVQPISFRSDEITGQDLQRQIWVLDLQAKIAGVRRLRDWTMAVLAPLPGETAVDVGSGTGECAQELAAAVGPDGDSVGVEPNAGMREVATERAAAAGCTAKFVDGEAYALPLPDASVDVLRCERVFQHLAEPERAAAEIARVLRPGGRAVVIDSDWATAILHPSDPAVAGVFSQSMLRRTANPLSGRRLPGLLTAAGLRVTDIGSQALVQPSLENAMPLIQMGLTLGCQENLISAEAAHQFVADLTAAAAVGDFHMSVTMFAVLARQP